MAPRSKEAFAMESELSEETEPPYSINSKLEGLIHLLQTNKNSERGGFEPPVPFRGTLDFESSTFNRSDTSPRKSCSQLLFEKKPDVE